MLLLLDTRCWSVCFKAAGDVVPPFCSSWGVPLGPLPLLLCPTSWHSLAGAALLQEPSCWSSRSWWLSSAPAGFCCPEFVEGHFQPEGGAQQNAPRADCGEQQPCNHQQAVHGVSAAMVQGTARQQLVGALSRAAPWGCLLAMMQEWGSPSLNIPHWNGGAAVPFTSPSCINQVKKMSEEIRAKSLIGGFSLRNRTECPEHAMGWGELRLSACSWPWTEGFLMAFMSAVL